MRFIAMIRKRTAVRTGHKSMLLAMRTMRKPPEQPECQAEPHLLYEDEQELGEAGRLIGKN